VKKILAVAAAAAVGGWIAAGTRPAAEAGPESDLPAKVRAWIVKAYKNREGIRPGMASKDAVALARSAAQLTGDYLLPLAGTPYAPPSGLSGSMRIFHLGEEELFLDSVQLVLLVPRYDKQAMIAAVVAAGKEVGLALEPDEDAPDTYYDFDEDEGGRDLWVALGDGVVAVDLDVADDD
jgi:hypothetical protein